MTWTLPQIELPGTQPSSLDVGDLSKRLLRALRDLGAPSELHRVLTGASTISFELVPDEGTRMRDYSKLGRLDDLRFALKTPRVRVSAPIPGRGVIGVEIANPSRRAVGLGEVAQVAREPLTAALGLTVDGEPISYDLSSGPHTLCVGTSGSGKSSLVRSMIASLLLKATPDDLGIVAIDPKLVELRFMEGLPHMMGPVIYDPSAAIDALYWVLEETEARYELISRHGCQDLSQYNETAPEGRVPWLLVVCDEFADLVLQRREQVETIVTRIAAKGRAAGIHLCLCTQTAKREVITGTIRANFPARICLRTASAIDSRLVLEESGAEQLLGSGDAILLDSSGTRTRFQAPHVSRETLDEIVAAWRSQVPAEEIAA